MVYQYTQKKFVKIPKNTLNSSKYTQNYTQVYFIPEMCGSRKYPDLHHGGNWKFQGGGGVRGPGNSRGEGGWTIKSLSGGKYHFIFDLSSNIASYQTVRSFLGHK